MTTRWEAPDGARVDVITLTAASPASARLRAYGENGNGQWLRVAGEHGNFAGQVRTPAELHTLGIDLASLKPAA